MTRNGHACRGVLLDRQYPVALAHLPCMTEPTSVGPPVRGFRYLLHSVVIGDEDGDAASALTRYLLSSGTPIAP